MSFRRSTKLFAILAISALTCLWGAAGGPGPARAAGGMESFADLVDQVSPAVVNIRIVKTFKGGPMSGLFLDRNQEGEDGEGFQGPPDLHEFFRRFFGGPEGQGDMPREFKQKALGSGVIVSKDGFVLTNNHVVAEADEIVVRMKNGDELAAEIVGRDKKTDLALVRVKAGRDLPFLQMGDSDGLRVGDWVLAVGNPFGLEHTVTAGIVSAKGRIIGAGPYDDFIQTDASINPGNSGGPLVNLKGEVVGINSAIIAQGNGIGFAIPVNMVKTVMSQLRETGRVVRGWLGVIIQPVTKELAEKFKVESLEGALVADVVKDGPAFKAGIKRGDVIVAYDGRKVADWHDLPRMVAETPVGREVEVEFFRGGNKKTADVTVGELKDEKAQAEQPRESTEERLGMGLQELTPELAEEMGVPGVKGLVVTRVEPGGPAEEAGIARGDVILEAGQKPVTGMDAFLALVEDMKKGEGLLLLVQRGESSLFVVVKAAK